MICVHVFRALRPGTELAQPNFIHEGKAMKRICAWCGRELGLTDGREGLPVTHGVCRACRNRFFTATGAKGVDVSTTQEGGGNASGRSGGFVPTDDPSKETDHA
jgi:hypothetical protein